VTVLDAIPEAAYHSDLDTLSVSGMKVLLRNPARFAYERTHKRPATDVMDIGSVVHEMLLHGADGRIRVCDAYDWRKPAVRAQRDEWRSEGLIAIHRGQLREAARIRQGAMSDPYVADVLSAGKPEQSMYWTDPQTGVPLRGRVDWLRDDAIVDVKTTAAGGTDTTALERTAASMDWPMQAAQYSDGHEVITGQRLPFIFLVIEREPPYLARALQPSAADLEAGRERVQKALEAYVHYETHGYPAGITGIEPLPVAPWYGR